MTYQYRNSDYKDKTVVRPSYRYKGNVYTWNTLFSAMVWMTYFLCKHPNVGDSIVEEIRDVLQGGEMTPEHRADLV